MGNPVLVDTLQLLHLWLRKCHGGPGVTIIRARTPGSLLYKWLCKQDINNGNISRHANIEGRKPNSITPPGQGTVHS